MSKPKKQNTLPWASTSPKDNRALHAQSGNERAVHVSSRLLFKGVATKEFMVLRSHHVRVVQTGGRVVVVLKHDDEQEQLDRSSSLISPVVATAIFKGNVPLTEETALEYFNLHLHSADMIHNYVEEIGSKRSLAGWHFHELQLLDEIQLIVGSARQETGYCN